MNMGKSDPPNAAPVQNDSSDTNHTKIKGFLSKERSGTHRSKNWHQRWFVLDMATGLLSYHKYETLEEDTETAEVFDILQDGVTLTIQAEEVHGTTSPFCFSLHRGDSYLKMCAASEEDFRTWVDAISSHINVDSKHPDKRRPSCTSAALKQNEVHQKPPPFYKMFVIHDGIFGYGVLALFNPIAALCYYGNWLTFIILCALVNIYWVWLLVLSEAGDTLDHVAESVSTEEKVRQKRQSSISSKKDLDAETKAEPTSCEEVSASDVVGQVNGSRAMAGCSLNKCEPSPADPVKGHWTSIEATRFKVRHGPNYKKTKLKKPSKEALLELLETDIFFSDAKIDNVGKIVQLPKRENERTDIVVVNCQVPGYPPPNPLWGDGQRDGPGFNLVMYYRVSPDLRSKLDNPNPEKEEASISLLRKFMAKNSTVRDRFKAIGIVANPNEPVLGRTETHLLDSYNGQPILTRPQHRFYEGAGYFEIDIDAHDFNYVARRGLSRVTDHMKHMIVDFGFVIQGEGDDELPEQILGVTKALKIELL